MADGFPDGLTRPDWLSAADLDFFAGEFERTGLTGALNRYRNVDQDWADLAAWHRAPITQPSLFIGGELDAPALSQARSITNFATTLPGLAGSHVLNGCGHWVQQERPAEVNRLLTDWLGTLSRPAN